MLGEGEEGGSEEEEEEEERRERRKFKVVKPAMLNSSKYIFIKIFHYPPPVKCI